MKKGQLRLTLELIGSETGIVATMQMHLCQSNSDMNHLDTVIYET